MVLAYSIGREITGKVCAADKAFGRFERRIEQFELGPSWNWFVERATTLESELDAVGGFDVRIAEQLEATGCFMGSKDVVERYEQAEYTCSQIEETAMAFVVTLQTRLNALRIAANAVYEKASVEDALAIAIPTKLAVFTPALRAIWDVANYVKHNDEWGTKLDGQQSVTFNALVRLGVATGTPADRDLARLPTVEALCAISGESWLRAAIPATLRLCGAGGRDMTQHIQADFAPLSEAVREARDAHRKPMLSSSE